MTDTLGAILEQTSFSDSDLITLLSLEDPYSCSRLQKKAFEVTTECVGPEIYLRGLIELSNICTANCRYCGIRKNNHSVERYTLDKATVLDIAHYALEHGYGSIAIQAGERRDEKWIQFICDLLNDIHHATQTSALPDGLGITLSLGEQTRETYQRWADAAGNKEALRYLLRIETSNTRLFHTLHSTPGKHEKTFEGRLRALRHLKEIGYQVGTGVMIGLPTQTLDDLVRDIRCLEELDIDMIGMGPYITSLGGDISHLGMMPIERLKQLSLNMLAVTRIVLKDVNIAAATALETLSVSGRIDGILYGCNVVMPNITPQYTRKSYALYDHKSGTEIGAEANQLLEQKIKAIVGRHLAYNGYGSSEHWRNREGKKH